MVTDNNVFSIIDVEKYDMCWKRKKSQQLCGTVARFIYVHVKIFVIDLLVGYFIF